MPFKKGNTYWKHWIGRKHKKESIEKMKKWHKENPIRYFLGKKREDMTGENHFAWKGDKVGYMALHSWIRKKLGKLSTCEYCGRNGLKRCQINWANKDGLYKRNLSDWIRLCVKCHRKYDSGKIIL